MNTCETKGWCFTSREDAFFLDPKSEEIILSHLNEAGYNKESAGGIQKFPTNEWAGDSLVVKQISEAIKHSFLEIDYKRSGRFKYSEDVLTDKGKGLWELWGWNDLHGKRSGILVPFVPSIYARDPALDVVEDGVVGIDFGTKSTVVACKGRGEAPHVIRVDAKDLRDSAERRHYENPTILEFVSMRSFCERYNAKDGRPYTRWNDMTSAFTAQVLLSQLLETANAGRFFSGLKQWAAGNDRKERIKIVDSKGDEFLLEKFEEGKNEFDPIELYAYHIGLAINDQQRGKIYLRYRISCPCSFSKRLRESLRSSFEKGIKKSLPQGLLDNEEIMEDFVVEIGETEPQAYAVCTFHVKENFEDRVCYGVFDFGGGTTDFDFGVWRRPTEEEEDQGYGRVLEHRRNGCDALLGGENLLESCAYDVYQKNFAQMQKNDWHINRPSECESFDGSEKFTEQNSLYGRFNLHMIAEALRPLWEQPEEYQKILGERKVEIKALWSSTGEIAYSPSLIVVAEDLKKKIKDRINEAVRKFLGLLRNEFKGEKGEIQVFLAGNSCRSPWVREVFDELIKNNNDQDRIHLNPPAEGKDDDFEHTPTVKTGVALGLLKCCDSNIKMIDNFGGSENSTFPYYLGIDDGCGRLKVLVAPGAGPQLVPLWKGKRTECVFYYTTDVNAADRDKLSLESSSIKKIRVRNIPMTNLPDEWVAIFPRTSTDKVTGITRNEMGITLAQKISDKQFESIGKDGPRYEALA